MLIKLEFLYYVIPAALVVAIIGALFFLKLRKPKQIEIDVHPFIEAFGSLANIEEIGARLSRIQLKLKDTSLLNQEKIKQLGAHSIIIMSQKVIILIGEKAPLISEQINQLLKE